MATHKGGLTGLIYKDFSKRQKSGVWSLSEHYRNTNYIRDTNIPFNYLALGCYDTNELYVYDTFFNTKLSTNLFNLSGIVLALDFNYEKNLLAIGLSEPPYLKVFRTDDFTEILIPYLPIKPVNCVKFDYLGEKLYISYITDEEPYLSLYDTSTFLSLTDEPSGYSLTDLSSAVSLLLPSSGCLLYESSDEYSLTELSDTYSLTELVSGCPFTYSQNCFLDTLLSTSGYSITDPPTGYSLTEVSSGYSLTELLSGCLLLPSEITYSLTNMPSEILAELLSSGSGGYLPDLAAYQIKKQITNINISNNNLYLSIAYYDTLNNSNKDYTQNLSIYKLNPTTKEYTLNINNSTNINDNNINYDLNTGTITSSQFLEDYNLLVLSHYRYPYISFFDYTSNQKSTTHNITTITSKINIIAKTQDNNLLLLATDKSPYLYFYDLLNKNLTLAPSDIFTSPITSISLSLNDKFLFISEENKSHLFDFSLRDFSIPIELSIQPSSKVISSTFFYGPQAEYGEYLKSDFSINSIDNSSILVVDRNNNAILANNTNQEIIHRNVFRSIFLDNSTILSIRSDGKILSNNSNLSFSTYNNILDISSVNYRLVFLDVFGSVSIPITSSFMPEELVYISKYMSQNIKQISSGYFTLLVLTNSGEVLSSNTSFYNPGDLPEIKQISSGYYHVALLTSSNTVISYTNLENDIYSLTNTSSWENIQQVSCGQYHTLGLTTTNRLVFTGDTSLFDTTSLLNEENVIYIESGPSSIILVFADGSIKTYPSIDNLSNIKLLF